MSLTKKQADALYATCDGLADLANIIDPLCNLTTDGESDDRQEDTENVQSALTDFLGEVAAIIVAARKVGLDAEVPL